MGESLTILILNSEPRGMDVIKWALKYLGHMAVSGVTKPDSVVKLLNRDSIDLLIIDYDTIRQDDQGLFRSLREIQAKMTIRIILFIAGDISSQEVKRMYKEGVSSVLKYPFQINDVQKAIDDSMRSIPMALSKTVNKIQELDFFTFLRHEELVALLKIGRCRKYKKGEVIFDEGEAGDRFYVIINGTVAITKVLDNEREEVLARLMKGSCFGEMALLNDLPRSARARAYDDILLLELDRRVMEGYDDVVTLKIFKKLALTFTARLRKANNKVVALSLLAREKKGESTR